MQTLPAAVKFRSWRKNKHLSPLLASFADRGSLRDSFLFSSNPRSSAPAPDTGKNVGR